MRASEARPREAEIKKKQQGRFLWNEMEVVDDRSQTKGQQTGMKTRRQVEGKIEKREKQKHSKATGGRAGFIGAARVSHQR